MRLKTKSGKYYQKSLREDERVVAERKAKELWYEVTSLDRKDILYTDKRFGAVFKKFLDSNNFGSTRKERMGSFYNFLLSRDDCPLRDLRVHEFNNDHWLEYLQWRTHLYSDRTKFTDAEVHSLGTVRTPARATLHSERSIIRQMLLWASKKKLLATVPNMDSVTLTLATTHNINVNHGKTRGVNPPPQLWSRIKRKLYEWAFWDMKGAYYYDRSKYNDTFSPTKKDVDNWLNCGVDIDFNPYDEETGSSENRSRAANKRFARKRLYYAIVISEATLLRPTTELSSTRWRDLEITKSSRHPDLLIPLLTTHQSKRSNDRMNEDRTRTAVGRYGSAVHFLRWRKISREYGFGEDDDFIFPRWTNKEERDSGIKQPCKFAEEGRTFSLLLQKWGLNRVATGESITLYSCRHAAISRRISAGWNLLDVATAANTSVLSISQSYAKEWAVAAADRFANTFKDGVIKIPEERRDMVIRLYDAEYGSDTRLEPSEEDIIK